MKTKETRRAYYLANRDTIKAKVAARYYANQASIQARIERSRDARTTWFRRWCLDQQLSCSCGEADPVCLDFHHKNPTTKLGQVPVLSSRGWSKERIVAEVAKCTVVCANCHRKTHFTQRPVRPKRAWLWDHKKEVGCRCGESHPPCLDFHHLDPTTKANSVTKMVVAGLAKATILAEISKCVLMCANCHRKHHG